MKILRRNTGVKKLNWAEIHVCVWGKPGWRKPANIIGLFSIWTWLIGTLHECCSSFSMAALLLRSWVLALPYCSLNTEGSATCKWRRQWVSFNANTHFWGKRCCWYSPSHVCVYPCSINCDRRRDQPVQNGRLFLIQSGVPWAVPLQIFEIPNVV